MRGTSVTTVLTIEIDIEVDGTFYAGSPDIVSGGPDNWEQGDSDTVEIGKIIILGKRDISVSLKQLEDMLPGCTETIEEKLLQQARDDDESARDAAEESAYECSLLD